MTSKTNDKIINNLFSDLRKIADITNNSLKNDLEMGKSMTNQIIDNLEKNTDMWKDFANNKVDNMSSETKKVLDNVFEKEDKTE